MFSFTIYAVLFVIARTTAEAYPLRFSRDPTYVGQGLQKKGIEIPLRRKVVKRDGEAGAVGLGDFADL